MNDPQPVQAGAELAPCPFCGPQPELVDVLRHRPVPYLAGDPIYSGIECRCGRCGATGPMRDTEAQAIAAWNLRATHAGGSSELVERITGELIVGIGRGEVKAQGEAMDLLPMLRDHIATLTDELTRLREKVGRMGEALKPFAAIYADPANAAQATAADCRRAAEALADQTS